MIHSNTQALVGRKKEKFVIDYLTYYYKRGTEPFRSLSALSDEEAIKIMENFAMTLLLGEGSKIQCNICVIESKRNSGSVRSSSPKGDNPVHISDSNGLGESKWIGETLSYPRLTGKYASLSQSLQSMRSVLLPGQHALLVV